ncbi:hypothetical protein [Couchioplanes caeruleus]|uniref:Uncharacterized protein n=2 Tax=Couchioplanes caeruleus TaxID=56438 RepID=A0A1K0GAY4_9ACTN|nr:hypothetical protein [Couchioplanes caeruleus]OJF09334.1 hypothetical protein BG844_38200 [Couchioplanes caeruleus subsp. caeruleus]ROP27636.1 hypothetical protein EDD30_0322 [Couchioplanes caeruleus]
MDLERRGYVSIGPRPYLDRFIAAYRLSDADRRDKIRSRPATYQIGDQRFDREFLVHRSVLRPHGQFRCAGDAEAADFCAEIVDELVARFAVPREEAVARVNQQWTHMWIVGLDLVYHRTPDDWAAHIYQR